MKKFLVPLAVIILFLYFFNLAHVLSYDAYTQRKKQYAHHHSLITPNIIISL